jgi:type II secretory pathway component PulF
VVDPNIPRFNQSLVAVFSALAFVTGWWQIVPVLAIILAAGSMFGIRAMPFGQIYLRVVRPLLRIGPPRELEPAAPPRFAQTLGAIVLAAAGVTFAAGLATAGWVLRLLVCALALLAAVTRLCVGCEIYVAIARIRGRAA